jgi:hypothetical protein
LRICRAIMLDECWTEPDGFMNISCEEP